MPSRRLTTASLLALFVVLASIYMLAYSGRVESRDSNRLFDALSSAVDWGDFLLDLAAWENPPTTLQVMRFPLETASIEPMQVFAAAPLYLMARIIPGIGLIHTVWLFNIIVTATAGVVFALLAQARGYRASTALVGALAFGITTAVFPYSKTFFREPLTLLMLLLAAYFADRFSASGYRRVPLLVALLLALAAMILSKASALLALPALFVIALPSVRLRISRGRLMLISALIVGSVLAFVLLLVIFGNALGITSRYDVIARLFNDRTQSTLITALHTYLFSIGGSYWGTSPILLLALPGAWYLIRRGQSRYPIAALVLILSFAVGYAILNNTFWFGGLSWPPRFLLPIIPLVWIVALPVLEQVLQRPFSLWGGLFALLLLYGIWINLSGITLDWGAYSQALPSESGGLGEWGGGLNQVAYLRWVITPSLWGTQPLDIAWAILNMPIFYAAYGGVAFTALIVAVRPSRLRALGVAGLFIFITGAALVMLKQTDFRTQTQDESLHAMLPILEAETNREDVVLLSSPRYVSFFFNEAKFTDAGRIISLELQDGERSSEAYTPLVTSDYPPALLTKETIRLIHNLALTRDRIFLLVDGGPDLAWSVRPVERYLASYFYPLRMIQTSPITRLIEFSTIPAPDPFGFRGAAYPLDLQFGEGLHLSGITIPAGTTVARGDVLAVSFLWTTEAIIRENYTIALYLRAPDSSPIVQSDSQPGFGFLPTTLWQPNTPIWDHRALRLSTDLVPGTYQLWIKVYDFAGDGSPRDLPVTAGNSLEGVIGILPVSITVE